LLKALILEKIQQFDQKLQELLTANTQPIEKLKTLIREHIQLFINNPFIKDSSLHDEDFAEELNASEQHMLQNIISEASKAGLLHNANSQQIINTMQLFLKGIEATLKNSITYSLDSLESSIDFISSSIFKSNQYMETKPMHDYQLMLFEFIIFSTAGWILEVIYRSLNNKKIVNPVF
jgi:hypothetical protein